MNKRNATAKVKKRPASQRTKTKPKANTAIAAALTELQGLKPGNTQAAKLIELLQSWLKDESGYDEQTWPVLKKSLDRERLRTGSRRLFDG